MRITVYTVTKVKGVYILRDLKMRFNGETKKGRIIALGAGILTAATLCGTCNISANAIDAPQILLASQDNSSTAEELQQFILEEQTVKRGIEDNTSLEVALSFNSFSANLNDYHGVVVAKTVKAKKEAEEKRKKEEAERKRKEEEEAKKRALEEAIRRAEETGENVPNEDPNCHSWVKTYMGYQAVTCVSSYQYQLLNSEFAYTDPDTGLRMFDDSGNGTDPRYCIALGSFYTTTIGQKVDLQLYDGTIIPCILGDAKADIHTNDTNQYGSTNGDVAEFIIDDTVYYTKYDNSGTVNWVSGLAGSIYKVILLDEYGNF